MTNDNARNTTLSFDSLERQAGGGRPLAPGRGRSARRASTSRDRRAIIRGPARTRPAGGNRAPVAQLDRVPGFEPGGRRFESFRARHFPPSYFSGLQRCCRRPELVLSPYSCPIPPIARDPDHERRGAARARNESTLNDPLPERLRVSVTRKTSPRKREDRASLRRRHGLRRTGKRPAAPARSDRYRRTPPAPPRAHRHRDATISTHGRLDRLAETGRAHSDGSASLGTNRG